MLFSSIGEMLANAPNSAQPPLFSVIIAVYNEWSLVQECLRSLAEQASPPPFEVIVVDDGSEVPATDSVQQYGNSYRLRIVREAHAGIPAARNRGVQESKGEIFVFTDADCRLGSSCLSELAAAIARFPQHSCFQLHLTGDSSTLLGRAEELRMIALQNQTMQRDGRIRLLNTAGFAIRRSHSCVQLGLFNPAAHRGEDTLLLATLMQHGELPLFVPNARVQHSISLSFTGSIRKDVRSGWLQRGTFRTIAAKGIRVRMRNKDRVRMLYSTWKTSRQPSIGRAAWMVLVTRQLVERTMTVLCEFWPSK